MFAAAWVAVTLNSSPSDAAAPSGQGNGFAPSEEIQQFLGGTDTGGAGSAAAPDPAATQAPATAAPLPYDPAALSRWSGVMDIPAIDEATGFQTTERSPYIGCHPSFDRSDSFTAFAVDFRADFLPPGTYLCGCQFDLDLGELQSRYANVYRDYNGVAGYAGFQVLEDGSHVAILSIWDTYCVDSAGNTTTLRARLLYPAVSDNQSFGGEGTGAHCVVPYDWQAGHTYRMRLSEGISTTDGQCVIHLSVCDLETGIWTDLIDYGLGVEYTCMKAPFCSFLENFLPATAGQVRSACWSNYRAMSASTGAWVPAASALLEHYTGAGSYCFGASADSFWAITTGLPGRCTPTEDAVFSVENCETGAP